MSNISYSNDDDYSDIVTTRDDDDSDDYSYADSVSSTDSVIYNFNVNQIIREDRHSRLDILHNNKYYIGIAVRQTNRNHHNNNKHLLLSSIISNKAFFDNNFTDIIRYLTICSIYNYNFSKIHIMQLSIIKDDGYLIYSAIIKTYWIRLIQRHWRHVMKKRAEIFNKIRSINNLKYREIHGKHMHGLNVLPGLYGMLSIYNNITTVGFPAP